MTETSENFLMSNSSTNIWQSNETTIEPGPREAHHFPKDMLGFTAASAFIIAFFGTLGNLLTMFALPLSKKLRTTATAFVINLAVVELLFCVFILPMSGAQYAYLQYHTESLLSDRDCVFFAVARYTFTQVELQTIVAIALTRAIAVGCPRFYQKIDNKWVTGVYITMIWIYSFVLKIPILMGIFGSYIFNPDTMECDMASDPISSLARFISLIVEAIIPVLVIIILYIYIFAMVKLSSMRVARTRHKVPKPSVSSGPLNSDSEEPPTAESYDRKHSLPNYKMLKRLVSDSSMKARMSSNATMNSNRRDMRVARSIFIIFMMVIICSVPVGVIHAIDSESKQPRRFLAVHILYWLQYCLNVFVYVLMNRQYRIAYVELLSRILPSWERHKAYMFPWENHSVSSRPIPANNSSVKGRKGSSSQDSIVSTKDYKPVETIIHHNHNRLPPILEVNSNSCVSNDEVFIENKKSEEIEAKLYKTVKEVKSEESEDENDERKEEQSLLFKPLEYEPDTNKLVEQQSNKVDEENLTLQIDEINL